MTSEAYVWIWLPGSDDPVPAGVARQEGPIVRFAYGERYRDRQNAIALYDAELPLDRVGFSDPPAGLSIAGCLADAGPDSWGRRVILNRVAGGNADFNAISTLDYLAGAGSDRIGALDFQPSPRQYEPRSSQGATLPDLLELVARIEAGEPVPPSSSRRCAREARWAAPGRKLC